MGGGASKTSKVVKVEDFNQSSLTDDSFLVINLHAPSGFGGATVVLLVIGLGLVGTGWQSGFRGARPRPGGRLHLWRYSITPHNLDEGRCT